jgi:signal transduction histidine kinase
VCALFGAGICTLSWFNRKRHADMPSLISGQPGFSVLYLADPAGKLGFDEILSRAAAGGFSGERPAPGSNECVWYRLSVANDSGADLLSVLAPSNEFLLDVRLYRVAADGSREFQLAGNSVRWSDRTFPVLRPAFEVTLPARTRSVLYLRIFDPVKQPNHFLLWLDARVFRRLNNLYGLQLTGYFSLWTVMMAYNGFLYAVLRRRDYLFYFLYILSIGALIYSASDLSTAVVSWPHWPLRGIVVTILLNVTVFFLVQFSRLFLETRERAPRLDRLIRPLGWILLALCFACPAWLTATSARWYLAADVSAVLGVTAALPLLGLLLLRRRLPQAGLYVLAFVPLAAGVIYSLRESVGIPEARSNGIPALVGDALQLVFLALALAARYKRISDDASRMSLEYTARLESEVAERTLELRSSNESLARASRDKDRVLGIIGHDLRGPAHQLYSLSQVLSAGPGSQSPEDLVHLASEIEETCKAEIDLLDNLLLWSRMQSDGVVQIKAEVQPADEIVKASAASMERTARAKNIVIAVELEPGLGFKADTQVVQTVIRNLLGNAIKFTGTGGRVSVAVRSRGGRVEIAVTDTGTGMSETQLKELFKGPVSSTEGTRSEKGAGIGLVLCHDLALANGGELRIESQLGSGTTATLILPGADAALQTPLSQRPCSS